MKLIYNHLMLNLFGKNVLKLEKNNITPGTETMHLLRAEKGFIIAGQDTDGTMTLLIYK